MRMKSTLICTGALLSAIAFTDKRFKERRKNFKLMPIE